jgi:hypothetical protein
MTPILTDLPVVGHPLSSNHALTPKRIKTNLGFPPQQQALDIPLLGSRHSVDVELAGAPLACIRRATAALSLSNI